MWKCEKDISLNMKMFKRYFHILKNYNRICVNYHSISYKFIEHCCEKKEHIFSKNWKIQPFTFHSSVTCFLPSSVDILENKVVNLCICLRNGRVFHNDLEQVIQIYEGNDYPLLEDVSLVLLKCCGESLPNVDMQTRQGLTKQVWNLIQNKNCPLTLEHYNTLLAAYEQNSELINPEEFIDNMKIEPDESIYCSLLNVVSKTGDYELVSNIVSKLGENVGSWNKKTFNAVIKAYAMQGNITEAYKVINRMQLLGVMPSAETYLSLTFGFAKLGDITNILQIFEKNQPSIEHVMKVVGLVSFYGHGKHIPSILKFLTAPLEKDKLYIVNNTILELTYSGQRAEAFDVITNLPMDAEIVDACVEYVKCFVNEEIKLNTLDQEILHVIHELMRNEQSPQIINQATEVALSHGKETLALALFEDMRKNNIPVRSHYYWPLFLQAYKHLEKNKPYSLISHMMSLGLEVDEDTLIDYIFPIIDVTNPVTATKTIINAGINYPVVITSMSAYLLQNNRIKDAISLCSTFKVKLDFRESCLEKSLIEGYKKEPSMSTYVPLLLQIPYTNNPPFLYVVNALLNYAKEFNKPEQLIDLLEMLNQQNAKVSMTDVQLIKGQINKVKMDTSKIEAIQNLLDNMSNGKPHLNLANNLMNFSAVSIISPYPHPKKMDSKELQNHIIELENKGMNTRGTRKKLLQEYCQKNNIKGAIELKQYILSNDFEWTPGMSAFLFALYVKNNLLDEAEAELIEIQNNFSDFHLDNAKVLTYVTLLVKHNRLEDAFNVINNIKNVNNKVEANNKCFQLLNTIAESEHYDYTEKMIDTLVKNNYCKVSTSLLIPLFQKHFLNNDFESIINVFVHCVQKYKLTPLKQKIMSNLVKNLDTSVPHIKEKLKRVMQCISNVHGEAIAVVHLIEALAEAGQIAKLQEVFQMQRVSMKVLCHHFQKHPGNQQHILLTIFEAISNIESIPKYPLCNLMISLYEENNDYEAAITLVRKMEASNIKPSEYFRGKFSNLVASNRQKIENC